MNAPPSTGEFVVPEPDSLQLYCHAQLLKDVHQNYVNLKAKITGNRDELLVAMGRDIEAEWKVWAQEVGHFVPPPPTCLAGAIA